VPALEKVYGKHFCTYSTYIRENYSVYYANLFLKKLFFFRSDIFYISTNVTVVSLIRTSVNVRLVNRNSSLHTIRFIDFFSIDSLLPFGDNFGGGNKFDEDVDAVLDVGDGIEPFKGIDDDD